VDHADGFVFGSLADAGARADYVRTRRAGVTHARARTPRDPLPGEPVSVELTVGPRCAAPDAWLEVESEGRTPLEPARAARRRTTWYSLCSGPTCFAPYILRTILSENQ
jgi:hypothetical protein